MPSAILSGFKNIGRALSGVWLGGSMYPAISPETDRQRPRHIDMARDFADVLPQQGFKMAVSDVRWLAVSSDIVGGAIRQKTDYISASNFATHFCGEDREWGALAEEKCQQLDVLCCTRGDRYDWKRLWGLTVTHRATDGGVFLNLCETETGWPLVQPIEVTRIGSRKDDATVKEGSASSYIRGTDGSLVKIGTPYVGRKMLSGIIYSDGGSEIAYRVLGSADDGSEDVDISSQDMVYIAVPRWYSEGRPLPEIAVSALALQDIHLARQAQLTKHLHSARLIALSKTEDGLPPAAKRLQGDSLATRTARGTQTSIVEEGTRTTIKHKDEMTPWDTKTPGGEWMAYDDKIVASALHGLGWRVEMMDPKQAGSGANTRAFADQINTAMMESFSQIVPAILRIRRWQIAKLIQRGDLPSSNDWWKWGVTPPPEFSPDPGRAITSELEAVRSGAQSMPHLHRRWGMRPEDVLREQAEYIVEKREIVQEFELTPEEAQQLGTLAKPGDAPAGDQGQTDGEKSLEEINVAKARADAYGVGVRAGAVTQSEDDEAFMREQLGLPSMSAAVKSAWNKEDVRRPITITPPPGAAPAQAAPQQITEP